MEMAVLNSLWQIISIRSATIGRLFGFLARKKMWWLIIPMVFVLIIGFILIVLAQSTPVGPFIYTMF